MEDFEYDENEDLWIAKVLKFIENFRNDTTGLNLPHLRKSLSQVYPLFVIMYSVLILLGAVSNVALLGVAIKADRPRRDPTVAFLVNIGIAGLIQCIVVLPISFAVLLIQNWVFGAFLCYFLPMLQDIPIHVTMLTFVAIAVDRYRFIMHPQRHRVPTYMVSFVIWIGSVCVVMPYAIYMAYFNLQTYFGSQLAGVGLCAVHVGESMEHYLRSLFVLLYITPLGVIIYFHLKIASEIKKREAPISASLFDSPVHDVITDSGIDRSPPASGRSIQLEPVPGHRHVWRVKSRERSEEVEHDYNKEKRTQKYLVSMAVMFALCMFPLTVLKLVKQMVVETYSNRGHFDVTFAVFVWVAFLPNIFTPFLFFLWRLSRPTKERLRGYLRFSYRHHRSSTLTTAQDVEDIAGLERDGSSCSQVSSCEVVFHR